MSERRVEQSVDVPAGQLVEVSQYPRDTTDRDECQAV